MRAGSYNLIKPVIDIYGPLNNKIAYRINGTIESADSYRNQVSSKRYYINPSLLFKIGNRSELIVEGDFLKHEFTPDFGTGTLNDSAKGIRPASIAAVPRSRFMGTNWQYNTTIQTTASATFNHSFYQNWKLNSVLSFQQYKRDYFSVERIQALYYPQPGTWARPLGRVDTKEKYFTGQVNLNGQFKTGKVEHILLAGADADHYITNTYNYDVQGKIYDTINILDLNKFIQRTDIPLANRVTLVETPVNRFGAYVPVSYTHLRAHETVLDLVCRLLLEKKKTVHHKSGSSHHNARVIQHVWVLEQHQRLRRANLSHTAGESVP